MSNPTGELADRFHLLRLEKCRIGSLQRFRCQLSFCYISCDLGESQQFPRFITDRIDNDVRPKSRSVLAHTPALLFKPTFGSSRCQRLGWHVFSTIFFSVEDGEIRTDDFLSLVTLDAFSTRVPVRDHARRGDYVDRIVGHTLNKQPEPVLTFAQRLLGRFTLGNVACDFGEADQPAGGIADRIDHDACPESRAVSSHPPAFVFELSLFAGGL